MGKPKRLFKPRALRAQASQPGGQKNTPIDQIWASQPCPPPISIPGGEVRGPGGAVKGHFTLRLGGEPFLVDGWIFGHVGLHRVKDTATLLPMVMLTHIPTGLPFASVLATVWMVAAVAEKIAKECDLDTIDPKLASTRLVEWGDGSPPQTKVCLLIDALRSAAEIPNGAFSSTDLGGE